MAKKIIFNKGSRVVFLADNALKITDIVYDQEAGKHFSSETTKKLTKAKRNSLLKKFNAGTINNSHFNFLK